MFRKLFRGLFTGLGALTGYGVFLLCNFIMDFFELGDAFELSNIQEHLVIAALVIIFGLIFFRLTPALKNQSKKVANDIETDLQKMSANDLVLGTIGLIAGLIIAFLISQIFVGIKVPYVGVILNIFTYIIIF